MKKPMLKSWMGQDTVAVSVIHQRPCTETGKTITTKADLYHVDGTLLYRAVPEGSEVLGLAPQREVFHMAWIIECFKGVLQNG